jgi:IPT/TIG domain
MLRYLRYVWLLAAVAIFAAALPAAAAPTLTSISPASGYPGTQVTFTGNNFGATQGTGSVWLGNKLAGSIVSWSNTQIVAVVAASAASGSGQVQQGGLWSNSIAFTVIKPNITSISPTSGNPGNQVTFTGTNFGATQGGGSVWLGNKLAGSIVSWSDTQIVATVAATALSGSAQVQQNGVWGNSLTFTVIQANITSISPASGYPGTQVTINGTNFGATQGSGSVWLGNKLAGSIVSWSNTQIVATVAATALSGSAQVQQGGVWSNSTTFTVIQPNITSITPTSGVAGTQVTFTGTNFGATQGTGSVWLGSKLAGSIASWSNTQIVATVASGSITGSAQVQQGGVWSNAIAFTVYTPALSYVSPGTAPAGESITLTGTNFGATQGSGSVWLGSKLADSIISWRNTQIEATVASGSVTGSAQVQQGGVWSNSVAFNVITPQVSSISPTSGPVGAQVTFQGSGFGWAQGSGLVWIGTHYATVNYWSDTEVVATVAAGSATGAAQVYQNGVWSNSITYTVVAVGLDAVYVDSMVVGGGDATGTVALNGPAPAGGIVVALSSSEASVTVPSSVTVPAGETYASFTIGTQQVAARLEATITATYNSVTRDAVISVYAPGVYSLTLSQEQLNHGDSATGTVTLYQPAPAGGASVTLVSENPTLLPVQSTVTVLEGQTGATFTVTAAATVPASTLVVLTATYNELDGAASVTILPPTVVSVTLTPTTLEGGAEVTVAVTLSEAAAAGTTVEFDRSESRWVELPASVAIPTGQTTGQIAVATDCVDFSRTEVIRAVLEATSASATLTLEPLALRIDSVTASPAELVGSNPVSITLTLTAPAPAGGLEIDLYGGFYVNRPPFVVVPEGQTSITFPVETFVMSETLSDYIRGYHFCNQRDASLTLHPPTGNFVTDFSLATPRTAGGNLVTATVTLDSAAPSGGAEIALESNNLAVATVPASVTVAQGNTTATFDIDTDAVMEPHDVTIKSTYNGVIRLARLTVVPTAGTVSLVSLTTPEGVVGENDVIGTVTLSGAAPAGGIVVTLSGSRANLAAVPASVTVPQGATSATFTITTQKPPSQGRDVLVTATYDGLVRSSMFQVVQSLE